MLDSINTRLFSEHFKQTTNWVNINICLQSGSIRAFSPSKTPCLLLFGNDPSIEITPEGLFCPSEVLERFTPSLSNFRLFHSMLCWCGLTRFVRVSIYPVMRWPNLCHLRPLHPELENNIAVPAVNLCTTRCAAVLCIADKCEEGSFRWAHIPVGWSVRRLCECVFGYYI